MQDHLYTRCQHCHLFVDDNPSFEDSTPEFPIAPFEHLHRGDEQDERLDESHEASPSNEQATLDWWRANGPLAMRLRFVYADIEKSRDDNRFQSLFDTGLRTGLSEALDMLDTLR